jgi:predicted DNA-binding transcriptional regulator AlpA
MLRDPSAFDPAFCELLDRAAACRLFGGSRPIHAATLYRGVRTGRYPAPIKIGPNSSRWLLDECLAALAAMVCGAGRLARLLFLIVNIHPLGEVRPRPQPRIDFQWTQHLTPGPNSPSKSRSKSAESTPPFSQRSKPAIHKIVERAVKVGEQLLYCKSKVAHGNWVTWVKTHCPQISKSTVERWMKLAENKDKIEAEIKTRISKNSTVTFLSLREALKIANAKAAPAGGSGDTYERVEARLLKKLEPMDFNNADTVVASTIRQLKAAVAQKKAA